MQALSLGHAPTNIPSIQCAPIVISISASTPPPALRSNGWSSEDLMVLSGGEIRDLINCTQVFNPDMPVSMLFDVCVATGQDSG
jgi:hypothetical protein